MDRAPAIAGVQGIWSQISWARNNTDLDDVQARVLVLLGRLSRWLLLAQGGDVPTLESNLQMHPVDPVDESWANTKTYSDTSTLLRELREVEPRDDLSTQALNDRVVRQARWHAALATTWHIKGVVARDMAVNPAPYGPNDSQALANINLDGTDADASPETTRTAKAQLKFETLLDTWNATLCRPTKETIRLRSCRSQDRPTR